MAQILLKSDCPAVYVLLGSQTGVGYPNRPSYSSADVLTPEDTLSQTEVAQRRCPLRLSEVPHYVMWVEC